MSHHIEFRLNFGTSTLDLHISLNLSQLVPRSIERGIGTLTLHLQISFNFHSPFCSWFPLSFAYSVSTHLINYFRSSCSSWFPVHPTSMNNTNTLISSDNKGYAAIHFEADMNPGAFPGQVGTDQQ